MLACGSRRATSHGLELVVLNGCESLELGKMCLEAGVPVVVCWETVVADEAAYLFARGFFGALDQDGRATDGYARAFEAGKEAILNKRRRVSCADVEEVPYYELADPGQGRVLPNGSWAAGIPRLGRRPEDLAAPAAARTAAPTAGVISDDELTSQHAINDSQFPDSAANTDSAAEAAPATTGQ